MTTHTPTTDTRLAVLGALRPRPATGPQGRKAAAIARELGLSASCVTRVLTLHRGRYVGHSGEGVKGSPHRYFSIAATAHEIAYLERCKRNGAEAMAPGPGAGRTVLRGDDGANAATHREVGLHGEPPWAQPRTATIRSDLKALRRPAAAHDTLLAADRVLRNRQLPELARIKAARELIAGAL